MADLAMGIPPAQGTLTTAALMAMVHLTAACPIVAKGLTRIHLGKSTAEGQLCRGNTRVTLL